MAVQVAEPSAEQQEAAEREHVGVHDPGQRGLARSPGRRWIDGSATFTIVVSSTIISIAEAQHDQRQPARAACHGRHLILSVGFETFDRLSAGTHRSTADEFRC